MKTHKCKSINKNVKIYGNAHKWILKYTEKNPYRETMFFVPIKFCPFCAKQLQEKDND